MNGNDLLEFEEEHIETLEEDFLMCFTQRELLEFILEDADVMQMFKETFEAKWFQHVEEAFNNHLEVREVE